MVVAPARCAMKSSSAGSIIKSFRLRPAEQHDTVRGDINVSGKLFAERSNWTRLLEFLKENAGKVDTGVVKDFTLYGRSVAEGLYVPDEQLAPLGDRVRSAESPFIGPETTMGRMAFIEALKFAEWERAAIVEWTKQALALKFVEQGIHVGPMPKFFEKDATGRIVPTATAMEAASCGTTAFRTTASPRGSLDARETCESVCSSLSNAKARVEEAEGVTEDSACVEDDAVAWLHVVSESNLSHSNTPA